MCAFMIILVISNICDYTSIIIYKQCKVYDEGESSHHKLDFGTIDNKLTMHTKTFVPLLGFHACSKVFDARTIAKAHCLH